MLGDDPRPRAEQWTTVVGAEHGQESSEEIDLGIRRVDEDEVERALAGGVAGEPVQRVGADDPGVRAAQPRQEQVLGDRRGGPPIALDERRPGGAA